MADAVFNAGLHLVRSHRVETLGRSLSVRLAQSDGDPIVPQLVVVGSRGMERWLRHRIATDLGVCANVEFRFPGKTLFDLTAQVLGEAEQPDDPFSPECMVWEILGELPALWDHPSFAMVRQYVADGDHAFDPTGPVSTRTWSWAREVADALDRYTLYRSDWIAAWDQANQPVELVEDVHAPWQAELWRRIHARLGEDHFASRLERLRTAVESGQHAIPDRRHMHVFGVTALPPAMVSLLGLLGRVMSVSLYAFVPSELFWGDLRDKRSARAALKNASRDDIIAQLRADLERQNPLLTSLGRRSRDFQLVLEDEECGYQERAPIPLDEPPPDTTLARLQDDVFHLRSEVSPPHPLDPSIQVHACHGPLRQVEVLRETLLQLFSNDRTLQPRDVVVMTPDIELYAPLVGTVFSRGLEYPHRNGENLDDIWGPSGAPRIPTEIADLGLRSCNSVADAMLRMLELVEQRVTASRMLDLLGLHPVRNRFALTADDVHTVQQWTSASGIRWGIDAEDRLGAGQPSDPQNTILFGIERLALGAAMADRGDLWNGILPFDDMEGGDIELLGRFLHFVRTIVHLRAQMTSPRGLSEWADQLVRTVHALTHTDSNTAWVTEQVLEGIEHLRQQTVQTGTGPETPDPSPIPQITVGAIRRALEGRFDIARGGDRPITGGVSVCALTPMRSVPFRVVCLLGMDDMAFPRTPSIRGFDLIFRHPRVGDRDVRDEDRHLFLEALLSARDHLLIFYTGRDPRKNEPCPPAGPVAELIDVITLTCQTATGEPVPDTLVQQHPLQPFSVANFIPQSPYSFDHGALEIARRLRSDERSGTIGLFREGTLPEWSGDRLPLTHLIQFLRQPVKHLLNRRLGLYLRDDPDDIADREPIEIDALERWSLLQRVFSEALGTWRADPPQQGDLTAEQWAHISARVLAQGGLPLGGAGRTVFGQVRAPVSRVLQQNREALTTPWRAESVEVQVKDIVLHGTVPNLAGRVLYDLAPESIHKPRRLLSTWVQLLALAVDGGHPIEHAVIAGITREKGGWRTDVQTLWVPPQPGAILEDLVTLYHTGMTRHLPMTEKTSYALARALKNVHGDDPWTALPTTHRALKSALNAASKAWVQQWNGPPGEGEEPHLAATFDLTAPFGTADNPEPEFIALAERVWRPLFAAVKR